MLLFTYDGRWKLRKRKRSAVKVDSELGAHINSLPESRRPSFIAPNYNPLPSIVSQRVEGASTVMGKHAAYVVFVGTNPGVYTDWSVVSD